MQGVNTVSYYVTESSAHSRSGFSLIIFIQLCRPGDIEVFQKEMYRDRFRLQALRPIQDSYSSFSVLVVLTL